MMCRKVIELAIGVMKFNNHYKWTVTDITDVKVENVMHMLSDEFFKADKIISLRDMISMEDMDLIVSKPSSMAMYQLLDTVVILMNVQAKQFFDLNLKNQALTSLYQAVSIRKVSMHSRFDMFQLVHYSLNFVDILEKNDQQDRAITLLQSVMIICEHLMANMHADMVISYEQVNYFKKNFCFISERWQDAEIEQKTPELEESSSDSKIALHLSFILKTRLTMAYKVVGELLHDRGIYQDAYLAMNYHNVLYVELVGDAPIKDYKRIISRIEAQNSEQNTAETKSATKKSVLNQAKSGQKKASLQAQRESLSEDPFFNKPWKVVKREENPEDGKMLTQFKNEHGWQIILDYARRFEAIILVINVADFVIDGTYWIDLDDVKISYSQTAEVGEMKFLEKNERAVTE